MEAVTKELLRSKKNGTTASQMFESGIQFCSFGYLYFRAKAAEVALT